jgi:predicted cation transporter
VTAPELERTSASEAVGGLLATLAILFSLLGLAYRPIRVIPVAVILALVAAALARPRNRLVAVAVGTGAVCFVAGLTIAILTGKPLY